MEKQDFKRLSSAHEVNAPSACSPLNAVLPASASLPIRILVLGGALGPALFTAVLIVCSTLRPGYSHLTQFTSELGATGTSHATLMNLAGYLPTGLLIGGFGVALAYLLPGGTRSIVAGILIALFGAGITLAGIFHCDPGCPQPTAASFESSIHDHVSIAAFLACIAGIGLWAAQFRNIPALRPLWIYTASSSIAGLALLGMLASSLQTRALTGLWQRLMLGTLFGWCAAMGTRLFRQDCRKT